MTKKVKIILGISLLILALFLIFLINQEKILLAPSCGDGICDSDEDCNNCPEDCGNCNLTNTSLRSLAQDKNIWIGSAVRGNVLESQRDMPYNEIIEREFNIITPEGDMKFVSIHPNPPGNANEYDFFYADYLVNFAEDNDMKLRGHTLIWFHSLPDWLYEGANNGLYNKNELSEILCEHIKTVVKRYKGRIYAWDVVNEVIADEGFEEDGVTVKLRGDTGTINNIWLDVIGPEYIELAFNCAREADPEVKLFLNEVQADSLDLKSNATYTFLKDMLDKRVPIDGVGLEMHLTTNYYFPKKQDIAKQMKRLAELGLEIHITEIDHRFHNEDVNLTKTAETYNDILKTCLHNSNCKAFVMWGFTDKHHWLVSKFPDQMPGIFDKYYNPKISYYKLKETLITTNTQNKIVCGDNICQEGETCSNCEVDCGECEEDSYCGDGTCDSDENSEDCPEDCQEIIQNNNLITNNTNHLQNNSGKDYDEEPSKNTNLLILVIILIWILIAGIVFLIISLRKLKN